jgi:DNA-binding response OmpR family regulator
VIKQEEIDQLLKSGAEDYVKKPFSIAELTDKINATLQAVA